ncbi:N-acetyl-gamma-glutamyl-phosphate reductase [Paenibacillus glycanilyticus]|uniref:N-acetyl-gamma-glutamyl-phosphate reductase n=1 Tax=Paenibacillus glycanilyticus TaxID=126569 RepID=A0ABQ6NDZ5_9BACL|nr:N-acetyl-gamma-glutamyl-phosphate reductase [Paenibacillus glycanilyticus]GMK43280.1 N-acetyl-gamma-glutamyl-phosphate reductase [Paenibacillus glycanilyticus]
MKHTVFVDGQEGTTGLKLLDYLSRFSSIEVLKIDPAKRKDPKERGKLLNEADLGFLCLPDSAAKESVSLVKNDKTKLINASSLFRTDSSWVYGLPELKHQRERIQASSRISVPGCHATGFILSVRPLIESGLLQKDYPASCFSISGYTGAGKSGIEEYENADPASIDKLHVPRPYSLMHKHKHLPEMAMFSGLEYPPVFTPIKANYPQGLAMFVPLTGRCMAKQASAKTVREILAAYYEAERFVQVMPYDSEAYLEDGHFLIDECKYTNRLEIFVFGQEDHITIVSRYDNLGKGASGAAIQNMNLMLGFDEASGLIL